MKGVVFNLLEATVTEARGEDGCFVVGAALWHETATAVRQAAVASDADAMVVRWA